MASDKQARNSTISLIIGLASVCISLIPDEKRLEMFNGSSWIEIILAIVTVAIAIWLIVGKQWKALAVVLVLAAVSAFFFVQITVKIRPFRAESETTAFSEDRIIKDLAITKVVDVNNRRGTLDTLRDRDDGIWAFKVASTGPGTIHFENGLEVPTEFHHFSGILNIPIVESDTIGSN